MSYKAIIAIIATLIGFFGYFFYLRDVKIGKTKPHIFSWFGWSLLEGIAFFAQNARGGGVGTIVTGSAALFCLVVAIAALFKGEKNITRFDQISFAGALLGIVLWKITENPLTAVIIIAITDFLMFAPTFRKGYYKPEEETLAQFVIASLRMAMSLFAMESLNWTTGLYQASLVFSNGSFAAMLFLRRNKIGRKKY